MPNFLDPKSHLSQILQSAAHAAGCPVAAFYLCENETFLVAASYGCTPASAKVGRSFAPLNAAEQHSDALLVLPDIGPAHISAEPWLFGAVPARFVTAIQVAFGQKAVCGLLVVADTAPRWPSTEQQQMLRAHAAQITILLEYESLRQTLTAQGKQNNLTVTEARKAENRGLTRGYVRRARRAEAANQALENEKQLLEAEIQERIRIEARLNYVAFHDDMTALNNRPFFMDRLAAGLQLLTSDPEFRFAVLLVDLDGFKRVNDNFGHRTGDLLLIEIAQRLRSCVRAGDLVARIGGDEFAILIEGFEETAYVAAMATRLVEVLRYPVQLLGHEILPAASIGVAHASKYYREPEELLRDADLAMYEAKRQRLGFLIFDDALHRDAMVSSQLHKELRLALARSEFYVEYQPIFDLTSRKVKGLEALIRWQHPTHGPLQPDAFIGAAEELGLIGQIGAWVLREACIQMRAWDEQYPNLGLHICVNVSAHQLTSERFIAELQLVLASTGLNPSALQLEVTESVFLQDSETIATVIGDVRALGVRFTLDDFGTGYSSLSYLDRYPIDGIKIDKSFIAGVPARGRTVAIVRAIVALARALNLEIIAEGIEHENQHQALLSLGCSLAQGFLLSRPLSAAAVAKLLYRQVFPMGAPDPSRR